MSRLDQRLHIKLPARQFAALKQRADELGLTVSELVRRWIDQKLEEQTKLYL